MKVSKDWGVLKDAIVDHDSDCDGACCRLNNGELQVAYPICGYLSVVTLSGVSELVNPSDTGIDYMDVVNMMGPGNVAIPINYEGVPCVAIIDTDYDVIAVDRNGNSTTINTSDSSEYEIGSDDPDMPMEVLELLSIF